MEDYDTLEGLQEAILHAREDGNAQQLVVLRAKERLLLIKQIEEL